MHEKKLFCFGYGYCAEYLGHALQKHGGWSIGGTTRDSDKNHLFRLRGIDSHIFSPDNPLPDPEDILRGVTHILLSVPPGDDGDPVFHIHGEDFLKIDTLEWVGYLSTTGVYGNKHGAWIDENAEISPTSQRGSRRAKAEEQWRELYRRYNLPVNLFRLSGIYGPGRSALDSVRAGVARRIHKPGHAFNRIHVQDIVRTLKASMNAPKPGEAYNLADDSPAPSHEVISYACDMLDIEPPPLIPFETADMAPIARSFYKDNKRISNKKIKEDLGVELLYPDYASGLQACLAAEQYALSLQEDISEAQDQKR